MTKRNNKNNGLIPFKSVKESVDFTLGNHTIKVIENDTQMAIVKYDPKKDMWVSLNPKQREYKHLFTFILDNNLIDLRFINDSELSNLNLSLDNPRNNASGGR